MDMPEVVECLIQLHKDIEYRVDKDWLLESIRWNRCLPAASAVGVIIKLRASPPRSPNKACTWYFGWSTTAFLHSVKMGLDLCRSQWSPKDSEKKNIN
jgi:hypothetical protein